MEMVLREIKRPMELNGEQVTNLEEAIKKLHAGERVSVNLKVVQAVLAERIREENNSVEQHMGSQTGMQLNHKYIVHVRQYMTKPSSPDFDFQEKWNNNVPMPFRTMLGKVVKETRGMVYMDCHVVPMATTTCMRCGRRLTHPVSRLYGIGPECGGHAHINPFDSEKELNIALDSLKAQLSEITWSGWIVKSAIEEYKGVL